MLSKMEGYSKALRSIINIAGAISVFRLFFLFIQKGCKATVYAEALLFAE